MGHLRLFALSISLALSPSVIGIHFPEADCVFYEQQINSCGDPAPTFRISAEGQGFMCPFLTPIFIQKLQDAGATTCVKQENLDILVTFNAESFVTADRIRDIAARVGYIPEQIHVTQVTIEP